jgi:hypothetical protein
MATTAEHSLRYRSRQCDDDIVRDRHAYGTAPFLAQACPMSIEGQKQTFAPQKAMSALPLKADMCSALAHVCFGPIADMAPRRDRFRSSALAATRNSLQNWADRPAAQKISTSGFFMRQLDRQNKLEQRPIFAIR